MTQKIARGFSLFERALDAESQLIGKDSDVRKNRGQEEKGRQDEMVGWHHRLNGCESEQTLGDGDGQEGLRGREYMYTCTIYFVIQQKLGFSCGSDGKESTCNVRDLGSISELGKNPGERKGYPLQYSGLGISMNFPWGLTESDMTGRLNNKNKLVLEVQDLNVEWYTKVAADIQNAIQ